MAYTPLAGKFGTITVNAQTSHLQEWSVEFEDDVIDVSGFNSTPDADNNVLENFLLGLEKGTISIKGRYNSAAGEKPFSAPMSLRPGLTTTLFLGFSQTHGFTLTAKVVSVKTGTAVRDAGTFEANLRLYVMPSAGGYPDSQT
jgi:hypothetical protein